MQYLLHSEESSLFSELKEAGYYVWMNARNDLIAGQIAGLEEKHASEVYYKRPEKPSSGNVPDFQKAMQAMHKEKAFPYDHFNGLMAADTGDDWDDTRAACERILHPVDPEKPLCLFLGWTNPHPPYAVEEPYFRAIERRDLPARICYEQTQGKSRMIQRLHELVGMDQYTEEQWGELRAVYLAQCLKIDDMFRQVCDALKQAGEYDNSAIFFLSDHGDFCGDYGLPEKAQNTFEDCLTRVPLLIKPPKGCPVDPGISDSLAELVDFYATAMDYAQVEPDHEQFGRSLRSIVENRQTGVRTFVCSEGGRMPHEPQCDEWHASGENGPAKSDAYWPKKTAQLDDDAHEKGTMIFDGHYKYVHRPSGKDELYNLLDDPGERVNLYPNQAPEEIITRMRMSLLDWYQQTCDIVPRAYDNRFTEERLWVYAQRFNPPEEMEAVIRAYIREQQPSIPQIMKYTMQLIAAHRQQEGNAAPEHIKAGG